jgi:hypothetical protein
METALILILIALILGLLLYVKAMRKTIFYLRDRLDFQNVFLSCKPHNLLAGDEGRETRDGGVFAP